MYKKTIPKRLLALALSLMLLCSLPLTASAKTYYVGETVPIYVDFAPFFNLEERDAWGFPWMATEYCTSGESGATLVTSGDWLYCIDYYQHAQQGPGNSTATDLTKTAQEIVSDACVHIGGGCFIVRYYNFSVVLPDPLSISQQDAFDVLIYFTFG